MSEKWLCPRLADYLVIVGSRSPHHQASIQPPELLRRYPIEDHKVRLNTEQTIDHFEVPGERPARPVSFRRL